MYFGTSRFGVSRAAPTPFFPYSLFTPSREYHRVQVGITPKFGRTICFNDVCSQVRSFHPGPFVLAHSQCAHRLEELRNNGFHLRDSFKAVFLLMDI